MQEPRGKEGQGGQWGGCQGGDQKQRDRPHLPGVEWARPGWEQSGMVPLGGQRPELGRHNRGGRVKKRKVACKVESVMKGETSRVDSNS